MQLVVALFHSHEPSLRGTGLHVALLDRLGQLLEHLLMLPQLGTGPQQVLLLATTAELFVENLFRDRSRLVSAEHFLAPALACVPTTLTLGLEEYLAVLLAEE